jgi:ppGpp synthetase/RelA/SpoT-type nucleotidyltranferase
VTDAPQSIGAAYLLERARYEKLARVVTKQLAEGMQREGLRGRMDDPRAKGVLSLVRKCLLKHPGDTVADALAAVHDKAGVRVIVAYDEERTRVKGVIEGLFLVRGREDTLERYGTDRLGFLSHQYEISVRSETLGVEDRDLDGLVCEVQVQTEVQHAWALVSHPLQYKPVGGSPAPEVERRLNRVLALVELFDQEVSAVRQAIMGAPGYRPALMYGVLEGELLQLYEHEFDADFSLAVLEAIQHAYSENELAEYESLMRSFVNDQRPVIEQLIQIYKDDESGAGLLLTQPEGLALFERMKVKPRELRSIWTERLDLPVEILERFAILLGIRIS